jgi:hypothetical protein
MHSSRIKGRSFVRSANSHDFEIVWIPGGTFLMGTDDKESLPNEQGGPQPRESKINLKTSRRSGDNGRGLCDKTQ